MEGLILGRAYIQRGLSTEGNLRFKIDCASFIFGINLPFLLCFLLYLRAIFQVQAPTGLIFGGAYFWNFTVILLDDIHKLMC